MTRLDIYLAKQLGSRNKAQDAIKQQRVKVNGKIITKVSFLVSDKDQIIVIQNENDYVSRAGYKLEAAFEKYDINIQNEVVLDIGASTGGFSQVCLEHHASKIYALDVGHLQLNPMLENDSRIIKMEGFNARNIDKDTFKEIIDFICMDVSFISCKTILDVLFDNLSFKHMALLVKPQFECGPKYLNKNGILTNEKIREQIVIDIQRYILRKFRNVQVMPSPIKGRNGNQEYMIYAKERR